MKKTLMLLMMVLLAAVLFTSCEDKPKEYTVTFDTGSGSKVDSQMVKEGEKAAKPENPTRDGYAFDKWTTDKEGKYEYKFESAVEGDITLYAQWRDYRVGDTGPAGGIIVYDVDADNDVSYVDEKDGATKTNKDGLKSSECDWRYIEAAPADATVGDVTEFNMGGYNTSGGSGDEFNTEDGIGKGRSNTAAILATLQNRTKDYYGSSGRMDPDYCAANVAAVYKVNDIPGWYLPSLEELKLMWEKKTELGMTADTYISSTEVGYDSKVVSTVSAKTAISRGTKAAVRAIRYF